MEKGTLLSFFKPINSPKAVPEEPVLKEVSSAERNRSKRELENSSLQDPDYDPKSSTQTESRDKRKRKKDGNDEKPEPRKRIRKVVEQENTTDVKRNSIQNFFKKINNSDTSEVESTKTVNGEVQVIDVKDKKKEDDNAISEQKSDNQVSESTTVDDVSKKDENPVAPSPRLERQVEDAACDSDSSVSVDMDELAEHVYRKNNCVEEVSEVSSEAVKINTESEPTQRRTKRNSGQNAFSLLMNKNQTRITETKDNDVSSSGTPLVLNSENLDEICEQAKSGTKLSEDTEKVQSNQAKNAFTFMMSKRISKEVKCANESEPAEKEDDHESKECQGKGSNSIAESKENVSESTDSKESKQNTTESKGNVVENKENSTESKADTVQRKEILTNLDVKEVKDDVTDVQTSENKREIQSPSLSMDTPSRRVKDEKLSKMLSVLESVKDDDDDGVEPMEIDFTPKSRKKRKKKRNEDDIHSSVEKENTCDLASVESVEKKLSRNQQMINEDKENVSNEQGLCGVYTVECKGKEAQMDFDKFISGGKGSCILYQNQWITPNQFERLAGSRAKKYKVSLYINKKPLQDWLATHDGCGSSSGSGRSTPLGPTSQNTQKLLKSAARKINRRSLVSAVLAGGAGSTDTPESLTSVDHSVEGVESGPGEGSSRRSGRIARNLVKIEERRKEQEEIEKRLKDIDEKENERKKKGRLVMLPVQPVAKEAEEAECVELGSSSEPESDSDSDAETKQKKKQQSSKPTGKLAPIFMSKKKIVEDPARVAARRAFLLSSAPDQLRTQLKEAQAEEFHSAPTDFSFPQVTHIQQTDQDSLWTERLSLKGVKERYFQNVEVKEILGFDSSLIDQTSIDDSLANLTANIAKLAANDVRSLVGSMKLKLDLPVNRIFRRFVERRLQTETRDLPQDQPAEENKNKKKKRKSKEVEVSLQYSTERPCGEEWSSKYRPRCTEDMITNLRESRRLRAWLCNWSRPHVRGSSQSSTSTSESEGEDVSVDGASCALLTGATGCGKTAAVYALAEELGLHVLEVNASSCRTGKQVTSMLMEATQSQQVKTSQAKLSFFKPTTDTNQKHEEAKKARKAVILFEDIDIFFEEQDRGFYNAVNTICAATKRPIVFTSSDSSCINFVSRTIKSKIEHFRFDHSLESSRVSQHLQLMCLVEGIYVCESSLSNLVSNSSCVRDCILKTQYLVQSYHLQEIDAEELQDEVGRRNSKTAKRFTLESAEKGSVDSELSDEEESYSKYFTSTKSSRKSNIRKYKLVHLESPTYSHTKWLQRLSSSYGVEPTKRPEFFPLDDAEEIKNVPGMEEVLKRTRSIFSADSDVFDTEETKEETENKEVDSVPEKLDTVAKEESKKDEKSSDRNREEMEAIFRHLDSVSEFSTILGEDGEKDSVIEDSILRHSASQCLQMLGRKETDQPTCQTGLMEPSCLAIQDAETEALDVILSPQLLVDGDRLDVLTGLRNILRSEECRRVLCREGRRGGRFYHYLAKFGVMLNKSTTNILCNSLS